MIAALPKSGSFHCFQEIICSFVVASCDATEVNWLTSLRLLILEFVRGHVLPLKSVPTGAMASSMEARSASSENPMEATTLVKYQVFALKPESLTFNMDSEWFGYVRKKNKNKRNLHLYMKLRGLKMFFFTKMF